MNRNDGREIAERLHLLRDYFIKHADRTHSVSMADLQRDLSNEGFIGANDIALDKKTIYRDLDALGAQFDMGIEYVEKYNTGDDVFCGLGDDEIPKSIAQGCIICSLVHLGFSHNSGPSALRIFYERRKRPNMWHIL